MSIEMSPLSRERVNSQSAADIQSNGLEGTRQHEKFCSIGFCQNKFAQCCDWLGKSMSSPFRLTEEREKRCLAQAKGRKGNDGVSKPLCVLHIIGSDRC